MGLHITNPAAAGGAANGALKPFPSGIGETESTRKPQNVKVFPAYALTDLLVSGLPENELRQEIWSRFPRMPREQVYEGVITAMSLAHADVLIARFELQCALNRLADLEAAH